MASRIEKNTECFSVTTERFFEPCILMLLCENQSYGYEIIENLEQNHLCKVNTGGLYRTLGKLENNGYISFRKKASTIGPKKKVYTITDEGKKALEFWINGLEKQKKIISKLINKYKKYESTK